MLEIETRDNQEYRTALQAFVSGAGLVVEGDETTEELEEAIFYLAGGTNVGV